MFKCKLSILLCPKYFSNERFGKFKYMAHVSSLLLCVCQHVPNTILPSMSWILSFRLVFYASGFSKRLLH